MRVYLKNKYGGKTPGRDFIAEIPVKGAGKERAAKKAVAGVKKRVMKLLLPFQTAGGKTLLEKTLIFDGGKWRCKIKYPGAADYNIGTSQGSAILEPDINGKAITLLDEKTGIKIRVDEEVAKRYPVAIALIPKLVGQKEFKVLSHFSHLGRIQFEDLPGTGKFRLIIGKSKIKMDLKYDKRTNKFSFERPAEEANLLKEGSPFTLELADALGENKELDKLMTSWENLIEQTPEQYFLHFVKSIPDKFTEMTADYWTRGFKAKDWSGSIPKNYTKGLLQAQKKFILSKLAYDMTGKTSLSDVMTSINTIYTPGVQDLKAARDNFADLNTKNFKKGDEYSEDEYIEKVMKPIMESGQESKDYQHWYQSFVNGTFAEFGLDDFRQGKSFKARDIVKVFAYYTAAVDDVKIDGTNKAIQTTQAVLNDINRIKSSRSVLGAAATPAQLATSTGLPLPTVQHALTIETQMAQRDKYDLAAQYVSYVSGEIARKMRSVDIDTFNIPAPTAWPIDTFAQWNRPGRRTLSPNRFIDARPILKMQRDYITFDKYMVKPPIDRARYSDDQIIMPREDKTMVFPRTPDGRALYVKFRKIAAKQRDPKTYQLTDLEKAFHTEMQDKITKIEAKYPKKKISIGFEDLRDKYQLKYEFTAPPGTATVNFRFGRRVTDAAGKVTFEKPELHTEVENIERILGSNPRTITKGQQERAIKARVKQIIEQTVKADNPNLIRQLSWWDDLWD